MYIGMTVGGTIPVWGRRRCRERGGEENKGAVGHCRVERGRERTRGCECMGGEGIVYTG